MKLVLIVLLLFPFSISYAQIELRLQECRDMAVANSMQMTIAAKQKEKAVFTAKSYRAEYFPRLSGTGTGLYNRKTYSYKLSGGYLPTFIPGADGKLEPNVQINPETGSPVIGADGKPVFNQYAYLPDIDIDLSLRGVYWAELQLQQPIYMGGKLRAAHQMAKVGEEIADENIRLNHSEVIVEADDSYWQLLRMQEQLAAAIKYRDAVKGVLKNLANAQETGMITQNDVLKAQVRYNEAELLVQKIENGRVLSAMNLCRLIGFKLQTSVHISDSLSETTTFMVSSVDEGIEQRPDYQMLTREIELKEKEVRLSRSDYLPQFAVTAGYGYSGGIELNGKGDAGTSFNAMAVVEIPLFQWGAGRNKIKAAQIEQEISRLNLTKSADLMTLEVTAARFNIADAEKRIEICRNALTQAQENLRITDAQYQTGMESITNLLEAQAQWQKAWSEWIDAKAMLKLNETKYLKSIGHLAE